MDYIYDFIGALIGTWIFFKLFQVILSKFLDRKNACYVSFIGVAILILIVTSYTMGIIEGFKLYMPALFIWLVVYLVKINRKEKAKEA